MSRIYGKTLPFSSENGSLAQPKARTDFYTCLFTVSTLRYNLPTAVKLAPTLNTFKKAAKEVF